MTTKNHRRLPSLRRCNGRGFVELWGRRHYVGAWGTDETQQAYERLVATWLSNGRRLPTAQQETTVVELCRDYWAYCEQYFTRADGETSSSLGRVKQALRPLRALYGDTLARDFGPNALRVIRERWLAKGLARKTINDYTSEITRVFKWGASHELVQTSVYQSLTTVEGLRAGRSEAKEPEPVEPVLQAHIDAVRPFLSKQVNSLVQLQLLTAARPGELLSLRPIDLDTTGQVWTATLKEHKTRHIGRERTVYFGPKAQAILKEFLADRPLDAYLFSPREAEKGRHAHAPTHRRSNQIASLRKTTRIVGEHYTTASYRRAIERACNKADIPVWTPHRLRHNAATRVRRDFGLEAAQVLLGHARADVTQLYAERDEFRAKAVVEKSG